MLLHPDTFCCRHPHHQRPSRESKAPDAVTTGSAGLGDAYFPNLGNGGYDAQHYALDLKVDPKTNFLDASSTMTAQASQTLRSFNLDFHGPEIKNVQVNGEAAEFRRQDGELQITPARLIEDGAEFQVQVDYAGKPKRHDTPHAPIPIGWVAIKDGSYVLSEPDGAAHWFPCNDHPRDKATYDFNVTVPDGYTAVANGRLLERRQAPDGTTFHWQANDPMATYLVTVDVGMFEEQKSEGPNGLPIHNFFPAAIAEDAKHDFGRVPEMVQWFSERFGAYPFADYGNIVLNANVGGAALETQTRPVYEKGMVTGDRQMEFIYAHELAHQWWGNSVSVHNWKDIWLSEGFACYAHMMWQHEHSGGVGRLDKALESMHRRMPANTALVAEPGKDDMFHPTVYNRGALTLHALRKKLGDEQFFQTLTSWGDEYRGKNVTTDDFVQHVNTATGQDLTGFFDTWVRSEKLPAWPVDKAA